MALGIFEFRVAFEDDGITVKCFLRRKCGLSARSLTVIKYDGGSIKCGEKELRAHDILHRGDVIRVALPRETCDIAPIEGGLDVMTEDDYLLIVNKPAAMPVHPTKIHQLDTLANIVSYYQQNRGESYTFRALNRLDKDTSGCVILTKDRISYSLVLPTVQKTYIAVCEGIIDDGGTIDAPISLMPDSKIRRCVSIDGVNAVTHYEPIAYGCGHTLCRLWLETGRTHQIRCHMSHIGHPLAGDDLYGGSLRYIQRQALHCQTVSFDHPLTGGRMISTTDVPSEMLNILHQDG
ncbi:MAG: RluA family pseudouridine synthase [Ruminococcus sp.]|nr:RluA family pseudouridine synthase [Ruminococcus sp.]